MDTFALNASKPLKNTLPTAKHVPIALRLQTYGSLKKN
jgi:hypothetical protein